MIAVFAGIPKKIEILFFIKTELIQTTTSIYKMSDNTNTTEYSLKYQIARQVGIKKDTEKQRAFLEKQVLSSWRTMMPLMDRETLSKIIWDFVDKSPTDIGVAFDSGLIGKYSTIREYENSKGKKHLAHFSGWGNYMGSVKQLGNKPTTYTDYVGAKENYKTGLVEINFNTLQTAFEIQYIFKYNPTPIAPTPITPAPIAPTPITPTTDDDDEDDVPLINLINKTKTKTILPVVIQRERENEMMGVEDFDAPALIRCIIKKKTTKKTIKKLTNYTLVD
jgi:hypothetical protein